MVHKRRRWRMLLLLCLLGAVSLGIGGVGAKYVRSLPMEASVTIRGNLAGSMNLTEHKAVKNPDGSYRLEQTRVKSNQYDVMPGVDIPKDPTVTIKNKNSVPAYLFLRVTEENLPDTVTYSLTEQWEYMTEDGGRKVYVYRGELLQSPEQNIPILQDNRLTVRSDYDWESQPFALDFYGCLTQKVGEETPLEAYSRSFATP